MASLLYGLAGKLVGELCSPLFKDYVGKPWELGTKAEFEKLKNTVSAIEAVLLDAGEKQRTNNQVRDWLIKIKLVFYDLEDLLQEVRTEDLKRRVKTRNKRAKKVRIFFSGSNQVKYHLKMGRKVKLIRERLDAIASVRNAFNFTERREETNDVRITRREETHSFVPICQFIGRDADKEFVTKHLLKSDVVDNVSVISIVGIGGMGKTTLAQSIYDSEEVKSNFERRMWVCVSDPFDIKLICENIIESVMKNKCERLQMEVVKEQLKHIIDGKKFLLVLDDVWNESSFEWMKLELLLTGGARGSKILITARAELVARAANSIATHILRGLSHKESWALFKQVAFKRGAEQVSPTIERIEKKVVEKCSGVPLVVKVIGSILALKEKEVDWLDFVKNDLSRVTQDSEGTVLPILRLSSDYLSAPLKRCFVYCAIYPKDYIIQKKEMIGMWMAHGLIQLDGTTRSFEDVGERYFNDLLDRSFFEIHDRAFELYKMHDLIHDLAQSVGGDEYHISGFGAKHIDKSTRHSWVSGDELPSLRHGEKLRTLVFGRSCCEQEVNEVISTFEQLRVLRLASLALTSLPQFVGGLRHLNYLDLSYSEFDLLPESLCCLYNLQTLLLSFCMNLKELPTRTRDLVSLRRLDLRGCRKLRHMPHGLKELTCLQTLSTFVGSREEGQRNCAEVCELKSLSNLRGSLEIKNLRGSKCAKCKTNQSCILMELELIKQLELRWIEDLEEEEEEEVLSLFERLKPHPNLENLTVKSYGGRKLPSWMDIVNIRMTLPNIVHIELEDCERWRHLPALGLLPSLQHLHLGIMGGIEYLVESSSSTPEDPHQLLFPSLKVLSLRYLRKLTGLVEPTSATTTRNDNQYFPVLEKLEIEGCSLFLTDGSNEDARIFPHLQTLKLSAITTTSLPEWMGNFTSLQELHLDCLNSLASIPDCMKRLTSLQKLLIVECPKLVSRCEKETGADWHKIAHIPKISVKEGIW